MSNYKKVIGREHIILKPDEEYEAAYETLSPSIYRYWISGSMMTGYYPVFEQLKQGDRLVNFSTGIVSSVLNETNSFLSDRTMETYRELKVTHKMGLLFYGKQGTGKTSTCMLIMKNLVDRYGALCLDCTGKGLGDILSIISQIRRYQNNPLVIFIDEFDHALSGNEEGYLTFLDGTDSVNNLIVIGCTNYIDKIPDRVKERKSRIKHMYNIDSLPLEIYKEYLTDRVPKMDASELAQFAYLASEKGLTIDQLKHALIDYKIENIQIEKAIELAAQFEAKVK